VKPVPLLARIRVATPCTADWAQMTGDERVRHCAHCNKNVFNLSDMTREQAERLIIEKNGDLCARYYQRTDGTILLADCSVGIKQKRKTRVLAAGAAALLAGTGGAGAFLKLSHHAAPARAVDEPVMGRMAVAQPEPPPPPETHEIMGDVGVEPDVHEMKGQVVEAAPIQGGISMEPIEQVHPKLGKLKEDSYERTLNVPPRASPSGRGLSDCARGLLPGFSVRADRASRDHTRVRPTAPFHANDATANDATGSVREPSTRIKRDTSFNS
jgi:hypothetical protein